MTITDANGCTATSNSIIVTVITVTTPTSLSTSAIGLDRATMNWAAVTNAHHYDVRIKEQGTTSWQSFYVTTTSKTKYSLSSSTT